MKRNLHLLALLFWALLLFILCIMPINSSKVPNPIPHTDKMVHLGLFFILSVLSYAYLSHYPKILFLYKILIILTFMGAYGWLIEYLQGKYFNRSEDIWDWVADMFGGITGLLFYSKLNVYYLKTRKLFIKNRR